MRRTKGPDPLDEATPNEMAGGVIGCIIAARMALREGDVEDAIRQMDRIERIARRMRQGRWLAGKERQPVRQRTKGRY